MRVRSIKYFIVQGFKGIFSNGLMSLASVSIVTASIAILGIFVLFSQNINYIGTQITSQCELQVYINHGTDRDAVRRVRAPLEEIEGVKEVILFTKEEAFLELKSAFNEQSDAIESLEFDNPLRDSYRLILTDVSFANDVAQRASQIENVAQVKNRQDIIQKITDISGFFRMSSLWLVLILGIISVFIISNTIKLGMFARRKEINIMKYVGATDWFIRWPFVVEGFVIGLIGAAIATALMLWAYGNVTGSLAQFMDPLKVLEVKDVYTIVIYTFLGVGGGIGILGSAISIRKHLKV